MEDFVDSFGKEIRKALGKYVGNKITHNFLFEIMNAIKLMLGNEIFKYYPVSIDGSVLLNGDKNSHIDFDVARHIVGIHRFNTCLMDDYERAKLEDDINYRKILEEEVIHQIKFRFYGSYFFREHPLCEAEPFLFYPLAYDLFVLSTKGHEYITNRNKMFEIDVFIIDIFSKALSSLSLLEDGFYNVAYTACRSMIENFIRMLVLARNKQTIRKYFKFVQFEVEKNQSDKEYDEEFIRLFNEHKFKPKTKQEYLYYGWVDDIEDYKVLNPYSLKGLVEYCSKNYDGNMSNVLKEIMVLYKRCHSYTHGVISNTAYPILHYQEIVCIIGLILPITYDYLCKIHNKEIEIFGLDMIDKISLDIENVINLREKFTTENFNKYYKIKAK